ncbi:hypothetical protein KAT51_07275 [bacterium]|nr:hypothetical protein [bacterium]
MQLIGRTLQEVARHFEKAQTLHETTVAETKARRRLLELEQEATTTDDIFNITRFNEGIRQIRMDTAAEVSLPLARRNFETSFDRLAMSSEFSISSTLRKRQADQMKTTMLEGIDALRGTINRENELDLLLGKGIDNLLITREAAFNLKKKTLKDWIESDIRDAIATDADTAKGNIVNGVYGDLTADETAKWLEVADKKIARNKKVAEVARDNKWLQQGGEVIKNLKETSVADLIQLTSNGDINPELGSDLVAWKTDPDSPQYETDKAIWIELAKGSTQPEVDLREFQISIGKAIANKTIQAEEGAEFVSQVEVLFEKAIAFKSRPSLKDRVIGTAIELFRQAGFPLTSIFSMIKELIEKVKKGESADELEKSATDILNKETTNQRPDIRVFGEQGQVMIDAQGNKARVFSDGRIEEIK